MSTQAQKLAWIQALRGIAAFMVVLVHSRSVLMGTVTGQAVADHVLLPMAMGVDLFFLISGFLMVLTTQDFDGTRTYTWRFTAKRIARIWPLFAIVSVIAVAVDHHGIHGFLKGSVLLPYLEGLLFIPHNPAASPLYFQMAVGVAWTLCFECYFYLVFAVCMLFGQYRYWAMAGWFAVTLIAVPPLRGGYNLGVASQPLVEWSRYANLAINPIVWEFVLGMLAGSAEERYEDFLRSYRDIAQRLPQHQVASYLGITPEALSRVRARRAAGATRAIARPARRAAGDS